MTFREARAGLARVSVAARAARCGQGHHGYSMYSDLRSLFFLAHRHPFRPGAPLREASEPPSIGLSQMALQCAPVDVEGLGDYVGRMVLEKSTCLFALRGTHS